jgi:ribosomal protein S18 acetylase RimI-like enzyme
MAEVIRRAEIRDVAAVTDLLFRLKSMYGSCSEGDAETFAAHYGPGVLRALSSSANSIWVAAAPSGAIVGFISTTRRLVLRLGEDVGVLEEIFVEPEHRRRGLASQLWQAAADDLRACGVRAVEVVTSLAHPGQRQFANSIGLEWYSSVHRLHL